MIKNIEELKNIQIVCRNQEQVKNCLNYLEQLGFDVESFTKYYNARNIVFWSDIGKNFVISNMLQINSTTEFYNKELVKTLQKFIKEKEKGKEQEAKTIVEYLRSKPIDVRIDNRQDYDNIINYLDKQNVKWNGGDNLKSFRQSNIVKALSFYNEINQLENGLVYSSIDYNISKSITVKELFKKFNIEYKELSDFEVTEDGRITKVNNRESKKNIYFVDNYNQEYFFSNKENVDYCIDCGLVFATEQARDKAMFKVKIETKLKNIAERLNDGRKIDWKDLNQDKFCIYYGYEEEKLCLLNAYRRKGQGAIYCLNNNFLEVAKQEIGEDNLIKYFTE